MPSTIDPDRLERLRSICLALPGAAEKEAWGRSAPERFFAPTYVGHKGWVGLWLDGRRVDWEELGDLVGTATG